MRPFYATSSKACQLTSEAHRWLGTPFRAGSAVPGRQGGVDCIGLCAAVHHACGACALPEMSRLPLDWHLHHTNSAILSFFEAPGVKERLRFIDIGDSLMSGDLVAVKTALCVHHLGIYLDDELGKHLLHVPVGGTVQRWSIGAKPLQGRMVAAWRIMEAAES